MNSFKQNELLNYIIANDISSKLKKYITISNEEIFNLITNKKKLNDTNYILVFLVFHACNLSINSLINKRSHSIGDTKINLILNNHFDSPSIIKDVLAFNVIHGFAKPLNRQVVANIKKQMLMLSIKFGEIISFFKYSCKDLDKIFL